MRVLLVEDERLLGEAVCSGLRQHGYVVDWFTEGPTAEHAILMNVYEAVVLDLGLPGKDGLAVIENVRRQHIRAPILILTARDAVADRVQGLDTGADDYLTKPFELAELSARLRALIRRATGQSRPTLVHGDIEVDPASYEVFYQGEPVVLSRREFAILVYLLKNAGRVATREQLIEALYGWEDTIDSNTLEVYIHHLRKKFGSGLIRTVRGVGYMVKKA